MRRCLLLTSALTCLSLVAIPSYAQDLVEEDGTLILGTIVVQSRSTDGQGYSAHSVGIGGMETPVLTMPRSVTVVTADLLKDRGITTIYDAIETTTGAAVYPQNELGDRAVPLIRGFDASSIQIDGMPSSGDHNLSLFDVSAYDRIEVLRGPSGVMQGAREPGGTVNLVRKRPGFERELSFGAEIGSWNKRRMVFDWGGPLGEDDRLRGRIVGAYEQADSFVDIVNHDKRQVYGVLEYDLSPETTLAFGATWQKGSEAASRGFPTYLDGTQLNAPRHVFVGLDWVDADVDGNEIFAEATHHFENGAIFTLKGALQDRERSGRLAWSDGAVDPAIGLTRLRPEWRIDTEKAKQLTAGLELPFTFWGLDQRLVLAADYQDLETTLDMARADRITFDPFNPDYHVPEPDWNFDRFDLVETREFGLTAQAEIRPRESLTFLTGGRLGWWENRTSARDTGVVSADDKIDAQFTPYLAGVWEFAPGQSAYASYSASFVPQTERLASGGYVDPREGHQIEIGYKREIGNTALLELALFQIEESNRALPDPNDTTGAFSIAEGKVRSRGFEAQVSGELAPNFDLSLGYAYSQSEYVDDPTLAGETFEPRMPRHSLKLWGRYRFTEGALDGLSLAGGISAYSTRSRVFSGATISEGGFYTADIQMAYRLNDRVDAALTVRNLFDREYYSSIGQTNRQNYYGTPREVSLQLTSRF